jgi:hypothetical protein
MKWPVSVIKKGANVKIKGRTRTLFCIHALPVKKLFSQNSQPIMSPLKF